MLQELAIFISSAEHSYAIIALTQEPAMEWYSQHKRRAKDRYLMPTQEERLAALEQSFGTLQQEIVKSIHQVNENSTILPGMLQTLIQESKQTGIRMEMIKIRIEQLETKFDAHTALLNEHTRTLSDHSARFDHSETLLTQILTGLQENP
jgi:hypothetical protein